MARSLSRKGIGTGVRRARRVGHAPGAGPGPGRQDRSTSPRRRSCCTPAATTSTRCSTTPRRVRDAGLEAAGRPGVITYSRKVFIPLTRLCRDRCHYCTFATVPGTAATRPYLQPGRGAGRSPARAPRWAARKRCSPSATGRRTAGPRPREWLDAHGYDDTLAYVRAMAIRVLEETGLLPHLNPGRADLAGLPAAQAGRAVDGHDAGDDRDAGCSTEPGGPHYGSPGQGPGRAAAGAGGRRPLQRAVHHRHPDRHRRDRTPSGPSRCSRSAGSPASTAASRKSSSRTSAPSRTPRCAACPTPNWTSWPPRSPSPGSCSARRRASRRRRTWSDARVRR